MSTYVMSDIHGDWAHFQLMLCKIKFSKKDTLYIIGDVVDRGPRGLRLLRYIRHRDNITLLMGNHELMLLEGLHHCGDGALEPAWFDEATFAELRELSRDERTELRAYLAALPLFLTVQAGGRDYLLVHACPPPKGIDRAEAAEYLLWHRVEPTQAFSVPVIAGHTPTAYYQDISPLRIWRNGNFIDIDCGTAFRSVLSGGCLACLRLDDGKEFYV